LKFSSRYFIRVSSLLGVSVCLIHLDLINLEMSRVRIIKFLINYLHFFVTSPFSPIHSISWSLLAQST
jgi:hypothetical protein